MQIMANKDLIGNIIINNFKIVLGTLAFNETHTVLIIPYTGIANPAATVNLTTYEYSLDGATWGTMTAETGTVVTNLNFTTSGGSFSFNWKIKDDLGSSIYNKSIHIRLQATNGTMLTTMMNSSAYFSKIVVNETPTKNTTGLPDDYQGIPGSDLLVNAPKVS
jgi:hypothetical protein